MVEIHESSVNDIHILSVSGKMLDADSMNISNRVKELAKSGSRKIILDLGQVSLLNSSFGLGVLAACWGCMNSVNGRLVLANPSSKAQRLFEITKLNKVFEIFPDVEQAMKKL